jgi:restriction endonuclease S subunit
LKKIGDALTIGSGRDYKHLSPGNIPVYGTGGFMLSVNDFLYDGVSACIGRKGTIDKPVLLSGKFWTVDTLFYTHKFINCSPEFIYTCFQMINWKSYCEASGVPSLSKSTIEAIEISLPCIAEQKQITDFFAALDNKITNIKSKLALSKQYKQGLLQQMFI